MVAEVETCIGPGDGGGGGGVGVTTGGGGGGGWCELPPLEPPPPALGTSFTVTLTVSSSLEVSESGFVVAVLSKLSPSVPEFTVTVISKVATAALFKSPKSKIPVLSLYVP